MYIYIYIHTYTYAYTYTYTYLYTHILSVMCIYVHDDMPRGRLSAGAVLRQASPLDAGEATCPVGPARPEGGAVRIRSDYTYDAAAKCCLHMCILYTYHIHI